EELIAAQLDPERDSKGALVVGYQGGEGAYSHMAAQRHFGARSSAVVCEGFSDFRSMLDAVKSGYLDYAVLPIENSIAGSINESYDLLASMDLFLVGEEIQPVQHCLIALDDVPLSHIRRVYSHPVALAQCGRFLRGLVGCHIEAYNDTALAVAKVRDDQDPSQAAIASEEAARLYGLPVIRRDIADQEANYTRMVIVSREPASYDTRIACKTSLILSTRHEQGALYRCIEVLARHGLNLTKLESRPKPGTAFEYLFYIDFEGNVADESVAQAIEALDPNAEFVRVLGSYPRRLER
ncbi:MAG: prephenate dehydratase, partial [Polyangiaceae bacterium]|nr:prephenate dehydratase [Polyangiaceae bacterium]